MDITTSNINLENIKEYYNSPLIINIKECNDKKKFLKIINNLSDITIKNLLNIYNYNYYYDDEFLIIDQFFDILENIAKEKNIKVDEICYNKNYLNEIDLPEKLDNIKKFYAEDENKINNTIDKYFNENILIASKLDGVSCLFIKNKKRMFLYTKGNTEKGRDISHLLDKINFNKEHILNTEKCILRGELIIKKENKKFLNNKKSLRSQVIGLINLKNDTNNLQKYIDVVFYQIFTPVIEHSKQYDFFKKNHLIYPEYKILKINKEENIINELNIIYEEFLENEKYEIDGLVISNPDIKLDLKKKKCINYFFAFKKNTYFNTTKVINITWNLSSNLKYTPILIIEPVTLNNSIIKKISGYNANYIIARKIGINSIIKIKLSGNVIPSVETVLEESTNIPIPDNSYWDSKNINLYSIVIDNSIIAKKILKYYTNFKIKHFAYLTIKNVIETLSQRSVIKNIFDYIDAVNNYFNNDAIEDKKILGVKKDIELQESINIFKTKKISIINILISTNKFKLFEENKFLNIFKNYPEIIDVIKNNENINNVNKEKLNSIDNISEKTIENFLEGLKYFLKKKSKFDKYFNINYDVVIKQTSINIVFTNVKEKDKACLKYLKNFYTEYLSVTNNNNITYVVTTNENEITEKIKKAKKYNIPIITIKDFYKILKK